ncbi:MAG: triose-phosphate isomerase [Myxococcota bacterium]
MVKQKGARPLVCGNWKLHHDAAQTRRVIRQLNGLLADQKEVEVVVAPVAVTLACACATAGRGPIAVAAQNAWWASQGAFTGEWSVQHLRELGCRYALVGHSERRALQGESDALVARKAHACLRGGIVPIVCVGETLAQHRQGQTREVLDRQLGAVLRPLSGRLARRLVVAYEPVWAIGTGQAAGPDQINDTLAGLHRTVSGHLGEAVAAQARFLYGGSVSPDNAREFVRQPYVDGLLVGRASLRAESFARLVCRVALVSQESQR